MGTPKLMFAHNLSRRLSHAPVLFYDYPFACPLHGPCRPATSPALETLRKGHRPPIARRAFARRHPPFFSFRRRPTLPLGLLPRKRTPSPQRQPPRPTTPATRAARRPARLRSPLPAQTTLGHRHR